MGRFPLVLASACAVSIPERVLSELKLFVFVVAAQRSSVSIPERVLSELKYLVAIDCLVSGQVVSIPERVLSELKYYTGSRFRNSEILFQSLKGF